MYLDYSKIESGQTEQPVLRLRTLAGKELGAIPGAHNLVFTINYAELSTVEFDVPFMSDGRVNPSYSLVSGYKVLYTEDFGIYVLNRPTVEGDGIAETKHVTGYSLEQLFEKKNLFLEEGTYDFWNPASPADTILQRILELDTTWGVGYVSPRLIGCYRTFDEYDNTALSFCYGDAMEKYECAIVFDVYSKTINAYDASESRGTLPIYLSYDNLVETVSVEELSDELVTKLHIYGSDDLTIRDVNPTGTDYLVDLSYFVSNGDLDIKVGDSTQTLAEKVTAWQQAIVTNQAYYTGLTSARATKTAQKLSALAELTELNSELDTLVAQQSVTIQALALETTDAGRASQQAVLDDINAQIASKNTEINTKQVEIDALQSEIDEYAADISAVNGQLAIGSYFTAEELEVINLYLIEGDMTEETFVATTVDASVSGVTATTSGSVTLTDSAIERVTMSGKDMYTLTGGSLVIEGSGITAGMIRGTLEVDTSDNSYVLTAYLGVTVYGSSSFPSGMLTASGTLSQFTHDVVATDENGLTIYSGTGFSFNAGESKLFFTVNVSEYQKYSVAKELYDFGAIALADMAWPVYEFSLDSANFLFQQEFAPFKDKLELGKAAHLKVYGDTVVNANLIGIQVDFEDKTNFSLTFSNQFRLRNGAESLADAIQNSQSSSRSFDANKYIYNQAANKTTQVSQFMEGTLDAAVNTILGASNQSVVIDGGGIQVGGSSDDKLRIVNNMICMTDDDWKTAKLAIGRFATTETGVQWGINAELVAGKLIIGNAMVLENATDDGVMQFKVDASGAWLNNSTFILQKDNGGKIIIDPKYGIVAGEGNLFTTEGTTVTPSFIDEDGDVTLDSDGFPTNSNFFLDINTGDAYLRGTVKATYGSIGGWTLGDNRLYSGSGTSYVALNASTSTDSLYAIWAGASSPSSAPFSVMRDGTLKATNGMFSGTLSAAKVSGVLSAADSNGWIEGCGIRVGGSGTSASGYNFYVDTSGNVTIRSGSISFGSLDSSTQTTINNANINAAAANANASSALSIANSARESVNGWTYSGSTYIDGTKIMTGTVAASTLSGGTIEMLQSSGYVAGDIILNDASSGYAVDFYSYNAMRVGAANNLYLYANARGTQMTFGTSVITMSNIGSSGPGTSSCGTSTNPWSSVYATSSSIITSDRSLKNTIQYDVDRYDGFFDSLQPTSFQFNNGTSGRTHIGMISQDVEDALAQNELTSMDFGGFVKSPITDDDGVETGEYTYALRYEEFIALCIDQIQKLKTRVDELEKK